MEQAFKIRPASQEQKKLLAQIESEAGTSINQCYQCGKCSAGCPVAFAMDYTPRQVIRLLQLNLMEEALGANSIWICASCEMCSTRCPREVDIASLMDALRRQALVSGRVTDKKVAAFNKAFLDSVRRFGKLFEAGLLLEFNTLTRQFFKDAELGLPMLKRKKVHLLPEKIKGNEEVKKIFERVKEIGGE